VVRVAARESIYGTRKRSIRFAKVGRAKSSQSMALLRTHLDVEEWRLGDGSLGICQ
jgi:hypothetical protein